MRSLSDVRQAPSSPRRASLDQLKAARRKRSQLRRHRIDHGPGVPHARGAGFLLLWAVGRASIPGGRLDKNLNFSHLGRRERRTRLLLHGEREVVIAIWMHRRRGRSMGTARVSEQELDVWRSAGSAVCSQLGRFSPTGEPESCFVGLGAI
jgi:hypothetical protein